MFTILLLCIAVPRNAIAYIDAGNGSYILQFILAALLGSLFAVKTYWGKIRKIFSAFFSKKNPKNKD
ncbi:MAG: hypothetical protein FJZ15_05365 [Candidatus Omnitrophica bacterium]|nr:hypothetical protein [Candidatus Omnitrophota bacterium]